METQTAFSTKPLLRPEQVETAREEIKTLENKLSNKHIEDKGEVQRQLRRAKRDFETQVPVGPLTGEEEGRMVARSRELLEQIKMGMPSQEEMRKAPPGAVDKHRAWEKRNKPKILEWKNLMLRLTAGSGEREVANLERHRPTVSSLSMDNAQIPGKQIYLPPNPDGLGVTFTAEQIEAIRTLAPELADQLGSLTNSQRGRVKEIIGIGLATETKAPDPIASAHGKLGVEKKLAGKKGRKPMTPEQKQALLDRLAAGRAKKAKLNSKE